MTYLCERQTILDNCKTCIFYKDNYCSHLCITVRDNFGCIDRSIKQQKIIITLYTPNKIEVYQTDSFDQDNLMLWIGHTVIPLLLSV